MAQRNVSITGLKIPVDEAARNKVLTRIKGEIDGLRDQAVKDIEAGLKVKGTTGALNQHVKESAHAKVDAHLKTKIAEVESRVSR